MPPNSTLIRDYTTFGDLSQRDIYHRHKNQVIKEGSVENYFYHVDSENVAVNTVVEKVSYDTSSQLSKYEVFTKPTSGNVNYTANGSMIEVTTSKAVIRSAAVEAVGNVTLGATNAANLSVSGTLGVTGNTSLSNVSASGELGVTGPTSLTTLSTSGLATLNTATVTGALSAGPSTLASANVTGETNMTNFSATGAGTITGTLAVTGNVQAGNLSTNAVAAIAISASTLSTTGNLSVDGNTLIVNAVSNRVGINQSAPSVELDVVGSAQISGNLNITGLARRPNVSYVWNENTVPAVEWKDVTYGGGIYVAVASTGVDRVMTSSDGQTWTSRTAPAEPWQSVVYGNNVFVAVATSGAVMTSSDGISWTSRSAPFGYWYRVVFGAGVFVAVSLGEASVMTSSDGVTWTARTAAAQGVSWYGLAYGDGLFVAVGGNNIMTSSDGGVTWTSRTSPAVDTDWFGITYGNGVFVAASSAGVNRIMTSSDGITWTSHNASVGTFLKYGAGLFVSLQFGQAWTSEDGIIWTSRPAVPIEGWRGIAYANGRFVAVADTGSTAITWDVPTKSIVYYNVGTGLLSEGPLDVENANIGSMTVGTLSTSGLATLNAATVTGNTSLSNFTASGNGSVTGTLNVTGATTLSTLGTSGLATLNAATVTGETSLSNFTASGNGSVTGTLTVTGNTSLTNTTIALAEDGTLTVTGNGNVNFTTNDIYSGGNVTLTGVTTISTLILGGESGFSGDIDMGNNDIINVQTLSNDNVRVRMSNTAKTIYLETMDDAGAWTATSSVESTQLYVNKNMTAMGNVSLLGPSASTVIIPNSNVSISSPEVTFGNITSSTNVTLFGNLDIKGTATQTRIESNIVQIGDMNIELGFLEINTLGNLHGAGITVGGPSGNIVTRPNLVYSSTYTGWQPNIDIVTKGSLDIARMTTDGTFTSTNVATSSIFTKIDSRSVNFGDKWRFFHDVANDTIELQHYESSTWVPKFTYTAN